ncbi:DNA-processing protein DprA [Winogradskya humida]|uniref:Smf/DprA SLOG domain-containing protein n=1 Tax=Winogradskya humida TaxID=113566 RepID=A0ABQ4A1U5_9ACTN|nr:DNA-processing protein DprA [Actinoplanes humidus]GIE24825.1 hypothetical protein Ahu01nite_079270 [Actinoplanes humidus]
MIDDKRYVRAALSYYVGGALPAGWAATAIEHGVPVNSWVYPRLGPLAPEVDDIVEQQHALGSSLWERAAEAGMTMLIPGDRGWPSGTGCDDLPCLWVRGNPDVAAQLQPAITVTGSFQSTDYGAHVAADLGRGLAAAGWTLITGANRGINAHAFSGALAHELAAPVLVTAAGPDHHFGTVVDAMITHAIQRGTVVSAFPPGLGLTQPRLQVCSRLLATMSTATVIVEAFTSSSAMAIADAAQRAGRVVAAVPGPVTSGVSAGCHQLIVNRTASLVTRAEDVLAVIAESHVKPVSARTSAPRVRR